jgi:prepilin-type N-terminal cleavage/methylation domain-containing protein
MYGNEQKPMTSISKESGFTAVELLITLFVAAAFLVAGYQLYNVVLKDGGQTRAQSRASNVAYDYMRRYSASATTPCTSSDPLSEAPITVAGLGSTTVTVALDCPYASVTTITKVTVTVLYNNPQQSVVYSTYVKR